MNRPTEDIDLFTSSLDAEAFTEAIATLCDVLMSAGYEVTQSRQAETYVRLEVQSGDEARHIDLGVDWRKNPPAQLDVGPTLSLDDAVGSKVAALCSRAEPRGFLDVDAIRQSGRYSDAELIQEGAEHDLRFNIDMFRHQLERILKVEPEDVALYGVSADVFVAMRDRFRAWGSGLAEATAARPEAVSEQQAEPTRSELPLARSYTTTFLTADRRGRVADLGFSGQAPESGRLGRDGELGR